MIKGYTLLGQALARAGVDTGFYIMGGPMQLVQTTCRTEEIRMIDVRHEQAAALSAQAYARLLQKPGVCMGASGPGAITYDAEQTIVMEGSFVKVFSWYDNEWGYSNRCVELATKVLEPKAAPAAA